METLISVLTDGIGFFHDAGRFVSNLAKPLGTVEAVAAMIILAVIVAGVAANGPWRRVRRPGEHPWD
ncbi:MAG: hypothetical protein IAE77_11890 [Prosthecobacter sp.]|jgi:hypothetical protein|uniref:hypothetical protein n=1 Tax=Prosthecobacter sp. TaxID=1965333 RepID=UPI001A0BD2F8|nr:hypothetical protein [Prosthecobacter sp.]MBE2284149.1 hypothetical protein [Prosthecobacter sp.]